jgi:hypothetical protein
MRGRTEDREDRENRKDSEDKENKENRKDREDGEDSEDREDNERGRQAGSRLTSFATIAPHCTLLPCAVPLHGTEHGLLLQTPRPHEGPTNDSGPQAPHCGGRLCKGGRK